MMTPKSTEHAKFYSFKRQSSFGIRKFTIGVVSVSLGTALVATAPAASADTLEPASSALAAPSAELVSQVTADKTALAQALSAAQAIDLSQQAPEVAEGFVELFVRASALLEQTGAAQAELDALTQELQQATLALTTELPTAVGTPVEVVEADAFLPTVIEEETPAVAEREAEVVLSTMTDILYPTSREDFENQSGARVDILTPEGQAMGLSEALDGGNGIDIKRKVRITMPAGATSQEVTVNLGKHLTFGSEVIRVGGVFINGQLQQGIPSVTQNSVTYRLESAAGGTAEFDVIFNVERNVQNLQVLGLSSDADATNTRLRQEAITAGGFVETRPLLITYRYTLNGKQSELKAGINTLTFPNPLTLGGQKITSPNESSYYDLVVKTMRKAMAEGKLPIEFVYVEGESYSSNKTIFNIDAAVGTEIDEVWSPKVNVLIPRVPAVLPTTPNGSVYDLGEFNRGSLDGSNRLRSWVTTELHEEIKDYLNKKLIQPDEIYLAGVNKTLADYGLRLEVDDVPASQQFFYSEHITADIDDSRNHNYRAKLQVNTLPNYRLRGTLRLPEGTVGNTSQTTWKDLFHISKFINYKNDPIFNNVEKGVETDYSKLSYTLMYSGSFWDAPGITLRTVSWGSTEFPLLTSVRVYDDSRPSQAEVYKPTAVLGGLTLGINDPIDPAQLIGNRADLPADARYEFVEPVGDPLSGTSKIVSVRITFSDGSVKTVRSRLRFRATQAQESIPEVQSLRVSQGSSIRPIDFIKNASSLPVNTRYSWSQEPSTRVPGGRVGQILVTYPDGSTDIITVRFTVR